MLGESGDPAFIAPQLNSDQLIMIAHGEFMQTVAVMSAPAGVSTRAIEEIDGVAEARRVALVELARDMTDPVFDEEEEEVELEWPEPPPPPRAVPRGPRDEYARVF